MTTNIKQIQMAFGRTAIELEIPERNIFSVILPSEPENK
jgi:nickel-dependent lactate racemase